MFKLQNLNVIRKVETEEEKSRLESQGFKEIGEVKPDYDDMIYNDLKQAAKEKNIEGYSSMKKEDLIAILKGLESEEK
ncbi:Rho termination factor N-terminal domain-containing protein [Clostridium sp. AWRP]|uniref:Rho termination factor N-terminal domain-containing protein n=1 Tax=Clostridium sp. AWRP TaxID=2212991 RepID=UPI000FDAD417|nr:Rho termination factor N-terminal domain-containing protein [Clostridium sp. AWRP]AZV58834.1 transcription termination factor Rho [Clostridium sp. AWRP]